MAVAGGRYAIRLEGELDLASVPELAAAIKRPIVDASEIILDVEELSFIDSAGLRGILDRQASCMRAGIALLMTPGQPQGCAGSSSSAGYSSVSR